MKATDCQHTRHETQRSACLGVRAAKALAWTVLCTSPSTSLHLHEFSLCPLPWRQPPGQQSGHKAPGPEQRRPGTYSFQLSHAGRASAKIRMRIMPTKSRGCWAFARTPASPTMPMASPGSLARHAQPRLTTGLCKSCCEGAHAHSEASPLFSDFGRNCCCDQPSLHQDAHSQSRPNSLQHPSCH